MIELTLSGQNRRPPVFVAQVGVAIGGADEHALARLDHFHAAVAGAVALLLAGDEALEQRRFSPPHGVHFGDFDQPFPPKELRDILAVGHVRQRV